MENWKKLFEVKYEKIILDLDDMFILEKGERVFIEMKPGYEWPRCHGYDIALEENKFNELFKEVTL